MQSDQLHYNLGLYDLTDATAEATIGAPSRRSTFTRMGAGALIAGPVGLMLGAAARKNTANCYVTIGQLTGMMVVDGPAGEAPAAMRIANTRTGRRARRDLRPVRGRRTAGTPRGTARNTLLSMGVTRATSVAGQMAARRRRTDPDQLERTRDDTDE